MSSLKVPSIILVNPQNKGNVGAIARVMSNFGASDLRVVGSFAKRHKPELLSDADWAMARKGESILENIQYYPDLSTALTGIHFAAGTSARIRNPDNGFARPTHDFKTALNKVNNNLNDSNWALVFGPENAGLSDEDCSLCNCLVHINTSKNNTSLNLAMTVGLLIYQYRLEHPENETLAAHNTKKYSEKGREKNADSMQIEKFSSYLCETLEHTQFFKYPDSAERKRRILRIFQSHPILLGELLFLFEAVYALKSKIIGKFEERSFLK